MSTNEALVQKLIHTVRLFNGFTTEDTRIFLSASRFEQHLKGERLIHEGETSYEIYVLLSGAVSVKRKTGLNETELASLGPGDTFGELALLDFGVRSASIDVVADARLLVADRASLFRLTSLEGKLYRNLAIMMASRLRETDCMLSEMATHQETRAAFEKLAGETQKFFVG
ncbi:MAG: cyclic nucleotide-binding domain-containing protein [Burkholderiales bacterium]|nr:cyclic nucleotide-binding domain-containing protein [Burkholderiales bacterium]